jgi:hypothetical protein
MEEENLTETEEIKIIEIMQKRPQIDHSLLAFLKLTNILIRHQLAME